MKVAITGKLRAGKSLVARHLVEHHGFIEFAFGDGLKEICRRLFPEEFANGRKPRALLQGFGQMARSFGDGNVWVNDCFRKIDAGYPWNSLSEYRVVITDVRQPNELTRCRAEGYTIIRVNAPDALRIQRAIESADTFNYRDLAHETEQHVDIFAVDYDIYNVGTLDELYAQIDAIISTLTATDPIRKS